MGAKIGGIAAEARGRVGRGVERVVKFVAPNLVIVLRGQVQPAQRMPTGSGGVLLGGPRIVGGALQRLETRLLLRGLGQRFGG